MLVMIRGAGDIATGIALRLHRSGYRLILTDLPQPTSIRRTVCFSEAVWRGRCTVEDTEAVLAHTPQEALALTEQGRVAVLTDPESACIRQLHPNGVVDAILAKRNLGTSMADAPVVIAVGPGFRPCGDTHWAVSSIPAAPCPIPAFPASLAARAPCVSFAPRRQAFFTRKWKLGSWFTPGILPLR